MNKKIYCQECGRIGFHLSVADYSRAEIWGIIEKFLDQIADGTFTYLNENEIVEIAGKKFKIIDLMACHASENLRENWYSKERIPELPPWEINCKNDCKWFKSLKKYQKESMEEHQAEAEND